MVSEKEALINIKTTLVNSDIKTSNFRLLTKIIDNNGSIQSQTETEDTIEPGKTTEIRQELKLQNPMLWSTDSPSLYKAVSEIYESGSVSDVAETKFGIRSISFDAVNGFLLNGKPLKLKGGCVHHDNGILGSRAYDGRTGPELYYCRAY